MTHPHRPRPGNRVVRRRLPESQIIDLPSAPRERSVPTATTHAKVFVLIVLALVMIGSVLLMLPIATEAGHRTSLIDAIFTATSATGVTGLATLDTQRHFSLFGELVILVLIEIGGFGFMAGTSIGLIMIGRGSSLRDSLMMQHGSPAMSLNEVTTLSRKIIVFILRCQAVGAVALFVHYIQREPWNIAAWYAIFHAVSSFANAGFDLYGDRASLMSESASPILLITIAVLTQLGCLSYMVLHDVWVKRRWRALALDSKLVLLIHGVLVVAGMLAFMSVEWRGAMAGIDPGWRPLNALFQSIVARTSGFATVDWAAAHPSIQFTWVGIMMVGGAAGSTAGGVKLATLGVVVLTIWSQVRGREDPQAFGRRIGTTVVYRAITLIGLFMLAMVTLTLTLLVVEDVVNGQQYSLMEALFEVTSGLATVGLSVGMVPALSVAGKVILIIAMLIGRIGPITVIFALQRRQRPQRYRYPEASVRIG